MEETLEWIEADPLPTECLNCCEEECYNCDYAGMRWYPAEETSLMLKRKGLIHTIDRLTRKISAAPPDSEIRRKAEALLTWYRQVFCAEFGDNVIRDPLDISNSTLLENKRGGNHSRDSLLKDWNIT